MHIGQLIRQKMEEKGKTVVWLARKLSCSRTNVYKIYEKSSIDTSLLARISAVLDYNFFADLSDGLKGKNEDCPR